MSAPYDALEGRDPAARERDLMARLPEQIAHARAKSPYYAQRLASVRPEAIDSRTALAELPLTRKSDLPELQRA
jgi:phenylacetate-CoA ligase